MADEIVEVARGTTSGISPVSEYYGKRIRVGTLFTARITLPFAAPYAPTFDLAGAEGVAGPLFVPAGAELVDVWGEGLYDVVISLRSTGLIIKETSFQHILNAILAFMKYVADIVIKVAKAALELVKSIVDVAGFLAKYWWVIALVLFGLLILLVVYRPQVATAGLAAARPSPV